MQEELERALQHGARRQRHRRATAEADRRRAHRPRRARLGPGRQLRARGRRPAAPERAARRRRGGAARPSPRAEDFDARRDARSRTYCYRVLARRTRGVFERRTAFWWPGELDRDALRAVRERCSRAGTTSRRSRRARPSTAGFSCDVARAEWRGEGELLEFWIEADMFLRHMNRVLVGTMLDVARGLRERRALRGAARGQAARARRGARRRRTGWRSRASPTLTRLNAPHAPHSACALERRHDRASAGTAAAPMLDADRCSTCC